MTLDYVSTLSPEIVQIAKEELEEDDHRRAQNVQILRDWLKKQPHMKSCPTGNISGPLLLSDPLTQSN